MYFGMTKLAVLLYLISKTKDSLVMKILDRSVRKSRSLLIMDTKESFHGSYQEILMTSN